MRRPRTKKQADRATDARIQKAYGITLEERDKLDDSNDEKCWICGRPPVNVRLSVDHDHAWKKVKVESHQFKPVGTFGGAAGGQKLWWISSAIYNGMLYQIEAPKKAEAVRVVKKKLKRASVRGLLCQFCNRGLRYYRDTPEILKNAAKYLENFAAGKTQERLEK